MLNTDDGGNHSGHFRIGDKELAGDLTFAGSDTKLYLHSESFFKPNANKNRCIQGKLHGFTKVSLFECIAGSIPGFSRSAEGRFNFATILPHFVLHGRRHLAPEERIVQSISFELSDAYAIFQDYDSFFSPIETKPSEIKPFVASIAKIAKRKIPTGRQPQMAIFTGRETIVRVKTVLGTVSVSHMPWAGMGSSRGICIENRIRTSIKFDKPVVFEQALRSLFPLLQFMELVVGRKQEISDLSLTLSRGDREQKYLSVYWCDPPKRTTRRKAKDVHVADLPIDAIRERKLFEAVLQRWLSRSESWKAARSRFSDSFTGENHYDADRLIGAANMFDLLPPAAGPAVSPLSSDLKAAHDASKKLFQELPEGLERNSILDALGRLKQPSLKRKIRHRAKAVQAALGEKLLGLEEVLYLGVEARNYFVHGGGKPDLDFDDKLGPFLPFLTNSLEFVFATSDLHEAGWPIKKLSGAGLSHPFGQYLFSYGGYLDALKAVLPSTHKLNALGNEASTISA